MTLLLLWLLGSSSLLSLSAGDSTPAVHRVPALAASIVEDRAAAQLAGNPNDTAQSECEDLTDDEGSPFAAQPLPSGIGERRAPPARP